ncbi:hypothetical protein UA08_09504 [Talaromyces atroroseus]|uniref:Peptidase A1 domain-containing protein n=1 Tax=Talaromyces atroroseus TaxID=1441469 RepID=A0A1Q5Q5X4_TALAT|nr:hypothetical protein UA08_09504 [Talaromyces atroroseus]OKL55227.1 hypothetical protein UA08_09504 [Talaromyces atroroseus]
MFFLGVITSLLSLTYAARHNHRHRAVAQQPSSTIKASPAIPTNSGSSVPITIGNNGLIGLIEIGSPGQMMDVQFDTTFNGVMVQSTLDESIIGAGLTYNRSDSASYNVSLPWNIMGGLMTEYTQKFDNDAYAIAYPGKETFNIGGTLYSGIPFGQLIQYYQKTSGQIMPFGGASGIIGLNYGSEQQPGIQSFMFAIHDQLSGKPQFKALGDHAFTLSLEWKCALDSSRAWKNGTWTFGSLESLGNRDSIAWADRNFYPPTWSINITAISAGTRKDPPITTWSATVATEEQSLIWPQKLLDWYFADIDSTWSPADNTYRYPCNATLPDFTFGIGNGTFTIPSTYMPYQRDQAGTTCISIITGDNSTDPGHEYTFGSWWAQLGVLILDYEHTQVGFMNKSTPLPTFGTSSLEKVAMN